MVSQCIINGCINNGKKEENDPNRNTLFYVFPSNPMSRMRWLKAIGRSDWEPPDDACICSDHFSAFQIYSYPEGSLVQVCRICLATGDDSTLCCVQYGELKEYVDTILPINNDSRLPQFVCLECAVHLRKCYYMIKKSETSQAILLNILAQNGEITESLVKNLNRENLELRSPLEPHKVMPTCVFNYKFNHEQNLSYLTNIEYVNEDKIKLDIKSESISVYPDHEYIINSTENFEQDENCVKESVSDHLLCSDIETDVANDKELSIMLKDDDDGNDGAGLSEESTDVIPINDDENIKNERIDTNDVIISVNDNVSCDDKTDVLNGKELSVINVDNGNDSVGLSEESTDGIVNSDKKNNKSVVKNVKKLNQKRKGKSKTETAQSRKQSAEDRSKKALSNFFHIVNLTTFQEKIDAWNNAMANPPWIKNKAKQNNLYKCEACSKLFVNVKPYEQHRAYHDPSYGSAECPVCKIRLKNEQLLKKHMKSHSLKFYCKLCPKSFLTRVAAGKHHTDHAGKEYKCSRCSYSSRNRSVLSEHVKNVHATFACELCGRACVNRAGLQRHHELQHPGQSPVTESNNQYPCEQCKFSFTTKEALRVHLKTAAQHKDPSKLALSNTCNYCGEDFTLHKDLTDHVRSTHVRSIPKTSIGYPKVCEYCDEIMKTGRHHYWHFVREHPDKRDSFNVIFVVICEICGKGFKNEKLLKQHKLRHESPKVPCPMCSKLFYEKALVEMHIANVHSTEKPHVCLICGLAMKTKSNFNRHMKIHTDVTPYECSHCGKQLRHKASLKLHIRTVHQRIYYPSVLNRKKRTRKSTEDTKRSTPRHAGSKSSATEPA